MNTLRKGLAYLIVLFFGASGASKSRAGLLSFDYAGQELATAHRMGSPESEERPEYKQRHPFSSHRGETDIAKEFTAVAAPEILSFDPGEGPRSATIKIVGKHFVDVQGVTFNGRPASDYTVANDTLIVARVPQEASSGRIQVRTVAGEAATFRIFNVIERPVVLEMNPSRGEALSKIRMIGSGLAGAQAVFFPGDLKAEFSLISDMEMEIVVPRDASSGTIRVVLSSGEVLKGPHDFVVTMAEAEPGMNLCRLTAAVLSQSSQAFPFSGPNYACDGRRQGTLEQASFSATSNEQQAWWEVDLGAEYLVTEAVIWNRTDCCQKELANFFVFVSTEPFVSITATGELDDPRAEAFLIDEVEDVQHIALHRNVRYMRIQHIGIGELNLAEVELLAGDGSSTAVDDSAFPGEREGLSLSPAYPSPFYQTATIEYELARAGRVRLAVFDALGREVSVLTDRYEAGGRHAVTFEAESFPAGVYYYRLSSEGESRTGSMVLAR